MPDRLDILVLGPLEVRRGGEPMSVPGVKLRGLVALLTLRAGEVVSADALIDAMWGESPPASARNALQVQVSGFRKLLARDPIARLQTRGTGYVLELAPDQTDLARFARLVEEGRIALAASEHQRAREILGEALALWRGRPLEGLEIPGLPTAAIADLEERHAAALSLRFEADLALGRHLDVLPELDGLRAEHPLDERVHALAALAYYRAGRQADALDVCASLRRTLSEELGIEPGPAIARLERQLLDQDPALDLAPPRRDDTVREARRTVTALVCRLTAARAGERLDPETQRAALGSAVEAAREVIAAHGGSVGQVIGGRIAATFGIPQVHEDDPVRAVRAADELRSSSRTWTPREGIRIEFRAAVATGEVLVLDSGDERSLLSVDPIEEADRLTRAARPGEVLLTRTTGGLARHAVEAAPAEIVLLGDEGPAGSALRLGDVSGDADRGRRLSSPLVGRTAELAVLQQAFTRVTREAASSLVTVLGPAGVGKSRLAAEFLSSVGPDATILVGRCLPYGRDITFWPIAEMVRSAAGISLGEPADVATAKLTALLEGEPEADYIVEQILVILGLVDAFAPAEEVSWAVLRFLTASARTSPLIVVLEDLHWADATLLDLVEYVVEASRDAPLLVLCLARPELVQGRPSWGGGRLDATNLTLGALDGDESSQLLDNLLGQAELDGATRRRIMEAAEGHPLFLEELLGMLIDEGILSRKEGRWVLVRDLSAFHLPPTVQALFDARLDRLSPGERATLEHAAIIGREFSEQDLRVLSEDADGLERVLGQLVRRDFLELDRTSRTGRTYRFRHILLHDAVYEGMSRESRARDHEAFGSYLEGQAGERIAEIEEVVGYHFESAATCRASLGQAGDGLAARAAARLSSAGRRAFSREDMPAAASLFGRTLSLLQEDDPAVPEVYWHLGVALFDMGRLNEADEVLLEGISVAERADAPSWAWRMRIEQAELGFWRSPKQRDTYALERLAAEATQAFERVGDRAGMARACRLTADAVARRGHSAEAVELYLRAYGWAADAGDEREIAQRQSSGGAHGPIPAERCIEIIRRNLERARRPNPDALAPLGLMLGMVGRSQEARAAFEEGLERARALGVQWKTANVLMHEGAAFLVEGDAARAEAILRPAVESLQRMGEHSMMSTAVALLAEALYRLGRDDEAMLATIVSEGASADDDVASQMAWRGVRAKILARRGELREAERLGRMAVDVAEQTDMLNMAGDAHMDLATVLEAAGDREGALREFARALELYEEKGNIVSAQRARARAIVRAPA